MEKNTVKRRIFVSNTIMILVTLILFFLINVAFVKVYTESVENEFKMSMNQYMDNDDLEEMVKEWTIKKNAFILLFIADGILCVFTLVAVSQLFTRNLSKHIMDPLNELCEGAIRIQNNNLSQNILYTGDVEFEKVCMAFNEMQVHILDEQEKNRMYEKARTDMVAGISHDLKTPLTAIKGSIKGILDGVASTPNMQQNFLNIAYRRSQEMDVLLNQLLYLSKLETGNMPLTIRQINLTKYLSEYVIEKQKVLDLEKVELHTNIQKKECYVMIDPEQMQRVLDNILENSIKYSEKDLVHIEISLNQTKEQVHLLVSDDGKGIEEEKLQYIFDEFYRGDESRNQKEGNGLGLYIVKYLVESMKGTVKASNKNGFVVEIQFPLIPQES